MGGKTNHSQASRVIVDNTLTASGEMTINQGSNLIAVSLNTGSNKIGKVDVYYPQEGSPLYIDCKVTANSTANTFNDQNSWIDLSGVSRLAFMLQVKSVPTPSTITGDVILEWSNDQTKAGVYESYRTYGTPSSGLVQATENTIFWTFALTPLNAYPSGQILAVTKKARYFRPRMRLSALSTTDATLQFQIQPIYF